MGVRRAHYTARIAKRLCEHIALGCTLQKALKREGALGPTIQQFWRWLDEYPQFKTMYEQARMMQADLAADTILEMAENVLKNPKFAPAYKVAADILKWQAEVRNPARYGQKVQVEYSKPLDPTRLKAEILQLEAELGVIGGGEAAPLRIEGGSSLKDVKDAIDVEVKEVKS